MPSESKGCDQETRRLRRRVALGCALLVGAFALTAVLWKWGAFKPREWPVVTMAEVEQSSGRLVRKGTHEPFSGWVTEAYPGGQMRSRSFVSKGVLEGVSEGWHTNGVQQVRETFLKGLSHGTVTKWSPEGALLSEANTQAGVLEGRFRRWHSNGVLAEEMEMRRGQADGLARSWYPSGNLKAEVRLELGKVVTRNYFEDTQPTASVAGAPGGHAP